MLIGLENCVDCPPSGMRNARLGLLMNQASVDSSCTLASDLFTSTFPGQLTAIFSPQHGLWGEQQANMIESDHGFDHRLGVPVYSLYGQTRWPTDEMLDAIDCLVIDLQDVGTRVYTFIWSMLECLRACAASSKSVMILDRPNPLGGEVVEGPMLDADHLSFVGNLPIPLRHGLTIGELALLMIHELELDVECDVVPLVGWARADQYDQLQRLWIWPSPNMPTLDTVRLYPGQVLLEGTNLSEGRGTTRPFELIGAPNIAIDDWLSALAQFDTPGLQPCRTHFMPTFDKWAQQSCGGLDLRIESKAELRSVEATVALLATAAQIWPSLEWLEPGYEYEFVKRPIDILFGNAELRRQIDSGMVRDASDVQRLVSFDQEQWRQRTSDCRLYD